MAITEKLTDIQRGKFAILDSLVGVVPDNAMTWKEAKAGRLARQELYSFTRSRRDAGGVADVVRWLVENGK